MAVGRKIGNKIVDVSKIEESVWAKWDKEAEELDKKEKDIMHSLNLLAFEEELNGSA